MDEGWLYGEWETGPWWAFHTKVFQNKGFFLTNLFKFVYGERFGVALKKLST